MKRIAAAWLAALLLSVALPVAAAQFTEGKDYTRLDTPHATTVPSDKVELREFFSYGCPHCFHFRPLLHDYMAKASDRAALVRVPVTFGRESWALLAKAYYAADALGVIDKVHEAIFNAIHVDHRDVSSADKLGDVAAAQGVDKDKFVSAMSSFAVDMKMRRARDEVKSYGVRSTPTVVVAGRFLVSPRTAGSQERMIQIIDYLVKQQSPDKE